MKYVRIGAMASHTTKSLTRMIFLLSNTEAKNAKKGKTKNVPEKAPATYLPPDITKEIGNIRPVNVKNAATKNCIIPFPKRFV